MVVQNDQSKHRVHEDLNMRIFLQRKAIGHAFEPEPMASYLPMMEDILRRALEDWTAVPGGFDLRAAVCLATLN